MNRQPFIVWTQFEIEQPQGFTVWAVSEEAAIRALDFATFSDARVWITAPQELREILSGFARSTEAGSDRAMAIDLDDQDHAAAVLAILKGQESPEA